MSDHGTIQPSAIAYNTNKNTLIICMVIGILFVASRSALRWHSAGRFTWGEDGFCWLALACQICVTGIYMSILSDIYFVNEQQTLIMMAKAKGETPTIHPDMVYHAEKMLEGIFPVQYFFWGCLWSVKFSLLLMFKRLTERVPFHLKMWWGVLIFTALAFVGCVVSQLCSCSKISLFTKFGECSSPNDIRNQSVSLYYSLSVDVLSDLLIMAIPISLVWNLQINRMEKLGVGLAFSAGIATIIVAFLRAFLLDKSGKNLKNVKQLVDITWLCFWASIECCIAIVVNCLPSFAVLVRSKVREHRSGGTHSNGYGPMDSKVGTSGLKSKIRTDRSKIEMDDMERYSAEDNDAPQGYRTRPDPGKYMASVSVGQVAPRRTPGGGHMSNSSQESIMGPEQRTKEVYVTRTIDIS